VPLVFLLMWLSGLLSVGILAGGLYIVWEWRQGEIHSQVWLIIGIILLLWSVAGRAGSMLLRKRGLDEPRAERTSSEPATPAPAPSHSRSTSEVAADGSATRVGLLNDPAGLRNQWQQVQGTFVDDPQRAVHEASELVERTLREIHDNVSRGEISDPTSTEELRVSFQRYREFFQRLLSA